MAVRLQITTKSVKEREILGKIRGARDMPYSCLLSLSLTQRELLLCSEILEATEIFAEIAFA
jgi:hypothetical protein